MAMDDCLVATNVFKHQLLLKGLLKKVQHPKNKFILRPYPGTKPMKRTPNPWPNGRKMPDRRPFP
jgi:hypothetical protein